MITVVKKSTESPPSSSSLQNDAHSVALAYLEKLHCVVNCVNAALFLDYVRPPVGMCHFSPEGPKGIFYHDSASNPISVANLPKI